MPRSAFRSTTLVIAALTVAPALAHAQTGTTRPTSADSVYARARQLVANGNGAAGRVLVDSMVAATTPDTPGHADALYWRATLAATGTDAEQDYRRIVVEYPMSSRTGDALLQLAQLELARGDQPSAAIHLERFLIENPRHAERSRAGLSLVRLLFDQNDARRGCVILGRALREVPSTEVEIRNQLSYFSPRCAGVDTTRTAAPTESTVVKRDTLRKEPAAAPKPAGRFTLQVAAYSTRAEADRLAARLKARGLDARVVGTAKPFRVRIGRYETRAAATAAASKLKAQKIEAIVTEIGGGDER